MSMGTGSARIALFVVLEKRRGADAMMPLGLLASKLLVGPSLATFLLHGGLRGLRVLRPDLMTHLKGYSATATGAALLPMALVIALTAPTMGRLAAKIGPRLPLTIGAFMKFVFDQKVPLLGIAIVPGHACDTARQPRLAMLPSLP